MAISRYSTSFKDTLKYISRKNSNGFTLIETIVVMSIVILMSSILIGYSRENGKQLLLSSTEAKLLSMISRTKFLSIETFFQDEDGLGVTRRFCAYGVRVDEVQSEIFIFQDRVPSAVSCAASNNIWDPGNDARLFGDLNEVKINTSAMTITSATNLSNVVFIPPDPEVVINGGTNPAIIEIGLNDGGRTFSITIDPSGLIKVN